MFMLDICITEFTIHVFFFFFAVAVFILLFIFVHTNFTMYAFSGLFLSALTSYLKHEYHRQNFTYTPWPLQLEHMYLYNFTQLSIQSFMAGGSSLLQCIKSCWYRSSVSVNVVIKNLNAENVISLTLTVSWMLLPDMLV